MLPETKDNAAASTLDMSHRRSITTVITAVFKPRHYIALINIFRKIATPFDFLARYVFRLGQYPTTVSVRTAQGPITLTAYTQDDIQTINEIFCRNDYPADQSDKVIVDFGSNIGISAAYFLSFSNESQAYLFEPVLKNTERLKKNIAHLSGRYQLHEAAIGDHQGTVRFGVEETGRYGGIGRQTGAFIDVPCLDSNDVLTKVINEKGAIDILKIDIETMEEIVTRRIPPALLLKIKKIYVEFSFSDNPLQATHRMERSGIMTRFFRKA